VTEAAIHAAGSVEPCFQLTVDMGMDMEGDDVVEEVVH